MWSGVKIVSMTCEKEKKKNVRRRLSAMLMPTTRRMMRYISIHEHRLATLHTTATMCMAQFIPVPSLSHIFSSDNGHTMAARSGWRDKA